MTALEQAGARLASMPSPEATPTDGGSDERARAALLELVQRWALLGVLVVLVVGFSISSPEVFATTGNFRDIVTSQPSAIFIALAAMVVLISGNFDLSLGANLGLCQYLVLYLVTDRGLGWPAAIAVTLAAGCVVGTVNALLVVGMRLNSFIATIGVSTILIGGVEWISGGNTPIFEGAPKGLTDLAQTELFGLALPVFYSVIAAVVLWIALDYSVLGRELRATGANRTAAVLSGLRTRTVTVAAFVVAGLLCSIAGILATARIGAADATSGSSYLLPAYAAAFLGATAIRLGSFNVWGTVIAIFVVATGITGLQLEGVESWVTPVFNGVVLLIAVSVSNLASRRRGGRNTLA